jgi:hypothetical protein
MTPTLDDYCWLVGEAAHPWLERVRAEISPSGPTVALVTTLRKDLAAERAHLVVEQVELRERGREKFALAERMFFTRKGLEQATDEQVAAAKAARFPAGASLLDLCCGIGGDLIALARTPTRSVSEGVLGIDTDQAACLLAEANLGASNCRNASVRSQDAAAVPVQEFATWHIDPDRRSAGRRTTTLELYEPALDSLDRMLSVNRNAAVKLAPATEAPQHWTSEAERQWLGSRGECRQQVAWFGSLAWNPGMHSATVVDALGGERTILGKPDEPIPVAESLGPLLYEPHAAILAAKLTGAVCREHSLAAIAPGVAYLTAAAAVCDPALAAFEVLEVLPLDVKRLKAWCRERRVGRLVIKKRGVNVDPNKLWKSIVSQGDQEALLIVTPMHGHVRVVVARRVNPPPSVAPAG